MVGRKVRTYVRKTKKIVPSSDAMTQTETITERKIRPKRKTISDFLRTNRLNFIKERRYERLKFEGGWAMATQPADTNFNYNYTAAFRMDSIYRPDYLPVTKGGACMGHDLLTVLYNRYKVYNFKAKVTFQNLTGNVVRVYVGGANSSTWISDYSESQVVSNITSRQGIKDHVLGPLGSENDTCTLTYRCRPCEVIGVPKKEWAGDVTYGAGMLSNPSNSAATNPYFVVGVGDSIDSIAVQSYVRCSIELTYGVLISDPVEATV